MSAPKNKPPRPAFVVSVAYTVFVKREGEKHPWTKRARGPAIKLNASSHDAAMHLGERELARELAERFGFAQQGKL